MKQIKTGIYFFVVIFILFLALACNQSNTSDKNGNDTTAITASKDTSPMPAYDPAMEPLTVGAKFSKKLGDTLGIKMYEFTVKPGVSHGHYIIILTMQCMFFKVVKWQCLFVQAAGRQDTLTFPTGMALISGPPLSDSGRNIGNTTIKLLVADIYRPRGK
ncbi:MAG: hypothetical protein WKG06_18195 [Segetibacter sp.]